MAVAPLSADSLRRVCDPSIFKFQDTSYLTPSKDLIGQERAVRASRFALSIPQDGYNLYMAGKSGTGKTRYALQLAQKHARQMPVPDDWCYVYNFEDPSRPKAINLPAGKGREFKKDMEEFSKKIEQEIVKAFEGEDYETERERILKEFRTKKAEYVMELNQKAQERGFKVRLSSSGLYFMPVVDGEPMDEDDYKLLDEDVKLELARASEALQAETADIIRKIREIELEAEDAVREWEGQIALYAVGIHIDDLKAKYGKFPLVINYLDNVKEDILSNLEQLIGTNLADDQQNILYQIMLKRTGEDNPYDRYKVNLIVDNSRL